MPTLKWSPSRQRSAGKPIAESLLRNDLGLGNMCSSNAFISPAGRFTLDALSVSHSAATCMQGRKARVDAALSPANTFLSNMQVVNVISLEVVFLRRGNQLLYPKLHCSNDIEGSGRPSFLPSFRCTFSRFSCREANRYGHVLDSGTCLTAFWGSVRSRTDPPHLLALRSAVNRSCKNWKPYNSPGAHVSWADNLLGEVI